MSMSYRRVVVGALLGGLLLVSSPGTAPAGEPQDKVRETVNAVLAVLQDKSLQGPDNTDRRREKMRQAVFQRFGFAEMAQRALGPYWQQRTPAEKKNLSNCLANSSNAHTSIKLRVILANKRSSIPKRPSSRTVMRRCVLRWSTSAI